MKFLIVGIFVVVVGFLVWRRKQTTNTAEHACAADIGALLKSNRDASKQAIADVFVKHGIARSQCPSVGRMVVGQLHKQGIEPDDAKMAMIRVREAYGLVP